MDTFVQILFIGFGILQIILFFKLWGMISDIQEIKAKITEPEYLHEARIAYLKGDKAKAKDIMDTLFFDEVLNASYNNKQPYAHSYNAIVEKYIPIYNRMEINTPDIEKYRDANNIKL